MRASMIVLILLAAAAMGCGHSEQRQAQDYERFLKGSLGTVATDLPVQAHASQRTDSAVD